MQSLYNKTSDNRNAGHNTYSISISSKGSLNADIDDNADVATSNLSNATAPRANAQVASNNCMALESVNVTINTNATIYVGIGLTKLQAVLHIK